MIYLKFVVFIVIFGGLGILTWSKRTQLRQFASEVEFEMTKVSWPSMDEVVQSTILVGIVTIFLALLCFAVDTIYASLFKFVFGI